MTQALVPWLISCSPLVLTLLAWVYLVWTRRFAPAGKFGLLVLSITTANAAWAAWHFTYFEIKPSALPPWKDDHVLSLGLLFLTVPVGMVLGAIACASVAPKWLIILLEIASLPLLLLGFFAAMAV